MRRLLPVLGFAAAALPAPLAAEGHECRQLRALVDGRLPAISRDLPYDLLDCHGVSEVYLLLVRFDGTVFELNQRIEAIFRRHSLVR